MISSLPPQELLGHVDFPRLKEFILKTTGLHYFADKDSDFAERVSRRLLSLRVSDCGEYLKRLSGPGGPQELDLLVAELTIGETYFFRHSEQFDALREQIIPDILARNRDRRSLRIWSAGCSFGAEPYSVSILLKTHFAEQLRDWNVSILATDINKDFLALAQTGAYDEWAFRGTPPDLKRRCFTQAGKKLVLAPEFKIGVSFRQHNLITDPFPPPAFEAPSFDLILCRNVVIYFSKDDFARIVTRFEGCLDIGGWLLVGHAEPNLEMFDAFCLVSVPGAILYQRHGAQNSAHGTQRAANVGPNSTPKAEFESLDTWIAPVLAEWTPASPELQPSNPDSSALPTAAAVPELDAVRRMADQGQWELAAAGCASLLQRDNLNSSVHCLNALVLEHLGQSVDAEQALRRAVYLDRNSVVAHYFLGVRQQRNRDYAQAARSFGTVEKLLSKLDAAHVFGDADGLTAGEMRQTAHLQMEALRACERRSTGTP